MDNQIEEFKNNLSDIKKLKIIIYELTEEDPILCIKILESL
jgi:hypothetical protein